LGDTKNTVVLLNYFAKKKVTTLEKVIGRREYSATLSIAEQKHLKFIHSPPRSSFKKLFIGTDLGEALKRMSESKVFPKGLRDEEVERGKIRRPPIPYIPTEDPIQESVEEKSGSKKFKVTLPDVTIVYHKVYDTGENEAFVIHVKRF